MRLIVLACLLLAGCAPTLPNPYTTPESERDRAACLENGGVWIEMIDRYVCRAIPRGEPA